MRATAALLIASTALIALAWVDWAIGGGSPFGVPYPILLTAGLAGNVVLTRRRPTWKRRIVVAGQRYVLNPIVRLLVRLQLPLGWSLLETTGRTSGQPRTVPVGSARDGDRFWIVAEHGLRAGYVRNILADPRVRVRVRHGMRTRWRSGTAHVLHHDDPYARQRRLIGWRHPLRALNAVVVRILAVDPVTIRIDLDSSNGSPGDRADPRPAATARQRV